MATTDTDSTLVNDNTSQFLTTPDSDNVPSTTTDWMYIKDIGVAEVPTQHGEPQTLELSFFNNQGQRQSMTYRPSIDHIDDKLAYLPDGANLSQSTFDTITRLRQAEFTRIPPPITPRIPGIFIR